MIGNCTVNGCDKTNVIIIRGWCCKHYQRWRSQGSTDARQQPTHEERFWAKVNKTDTCWLWTAAQYPGGYGAFWNGEKLVRAHRFSYELLVGPIPDGLVLDHLCRVRNCVRPEHLEVVTFRENVLRGEGSSANRARQTHCYKGHLLEGENVYTPHNGKRGCKTCRTDYNRTSEKKRKVLS